MRYYKVIKVSHKKVMKTITIKNKEVQNLNRVISAVLLLVTFILMNLLSVWSVFGLLVVFIVLTKQTGVQFNIDNRRYRNFSKLLFSYNGEWKELKNNKRFVILKKHGSKKTLGTMATSSYETKGSFSELYLMDISHTRRFYVDSSTSTSEIKALAKKLSEQLAVSIEVFNPKKQTI